MPGRAARMNHVQMITSRNESYVLSSPFIFATRSRNLITYGKCYAKLLMKRTNLSCSLRGWLRQLRRVSGIAIFGDQSFLREKTRQMSSETQTDERKMSFCRICETQELILSSGQRIWRTATVNPVWSKEFKWTEISSLETEGRNRIQRKEQIQECIELFVLGVRLCIQGSHGSKYQVLGFIWNKKLTNDTGCDINETHGLGLNSIAP
jgi:hypothetical protein